MTKTFLISLIVFVLISYDPAYATNYIKEKPDYMKPCHRKTTEYTECLVQLFSHFHTTWKNGVPGAENQSSLDPVFLEPYKLSGSYPTATFNTDMINILYTGLRLSKLKSVNANDKDYNFKLNYLAPFTRFEGNYRTVANILALKLNASGTMFLNATNSDFTVSMKLELKEHDHMTFFNINTLKYRIKDVETSVMYMDNLFKDKELNDNANALFNQRWREFMPMIQERSEEVMSALFWKHFQSIFNVLPAKFFIVDVEGDGSNQ